MPAFSMIRHEPMFCGYAGAMIRSRPIVRNPYPRTEMATSVLALAPRAWEVVVRDLDVRSFALDELERTASDELAVLPLDDPRGVPALAFAGDARLDGLLRTRERPRLARRQ